MNLAVPVMTTPPRHKYKDHLLSLLEQLAAEHPSVKDELRRCIERIQYRRRHPDRLAVLRALKDFHQTAAGISEATGLPPSQVYKWLRTLEAEGLVVKGKARIEARTQGGDHKTTIYELKESTVFIS